MKETLKKIANWVRVDGLLHILLSVIIVFAFGWVKPMWFAGAMAIVVGLGKEMYEFVYSEQRIIEWHDLICDVIGIIVGYGVVWLNLVGNTTL